jgi:muramoyltetrapeptide carboxypeptidase LdcA involved in peptidoglycan recycling
VVAIFSLDYAEFVAYGLDLVQAAEELAAAHRLDRQRADELIEALQEASGDATFCSFGGYFINRGMVPGSLVAE